MGGGPEDKEGDDERDGQESGQLVCRGIMRALTGGLSGRVFNEGRDILRRSQSADVYNYRQKVKGRRMKREREGHHPQYWPLGGTAD